LHLQFALYLFPPMLNFLGFVLADGHVQLLSLRYLLLPAG
jgi:hypothetical protein